MKISQEHDKFFLLFLFICDESERQQVHYVALLMLNVRIGLCLKCAKTEGTNCVQAYSDSEIPDQPRPWPLTEYSETVVMYPRRA